MGSLLCCLVLIAKWSTVVWPTFCGDVYLKYMNVSLNVCVIIMDLKAYRVEWSYDFEWYVCDALMKMLICHFKIKYVNEVYVYVDQDSMWSMVVLKEWLYVNDNEWLCNHV